MHTKLRNKLITNNEIIDNLESDDEIFINKFNELAKINRGCFSIRDVSENSNYYIC